MASLLITIPDTMIPRILATLGDTPSTPITKNDVEMMIKVWLKSAVRAYEAEQSAQSTRILVDKEIW